MPQTDYTPRILPLLGVTPETQPELCKRFKDGTLIAELLDNSLEADGLAVALVEIARRKRILAHPKLCEVRDVWIVAPYSTLDTWKTQYNTSFAAAVHDALVEALGIGEETE